MTAPDTIAALIADLEAATEGSLELDVRVEGVALRFLTPPSVPRHGQFTRSLDATLTLVPDGCWLRLDQSVALNRYDAEVGRHDLLLQTGVGSSLAHALTIAALKAIEAQHGE